MNTPQSISHLRRRFEQAGIRPVTRYGQNFLIDLNLLGLLAERAELTKQDVVLEVGGGTGSLTAMLAHGARWVVSVEIDPQLFQLAREELVELDNITMLQQDVLRNKNRIHPTVLETVNEKLAEDPQARFKLVANLPYNIATPLISNLLHLPHVPYSMTVTIQKELADRMLAVPRTKDYGALSVWLQSHCSIELLRVLPPTAFWPRPKVHSAIIQIVPDDAKRAQIPDLDYFHRFVRAMFFHRRKFLRSELISAFKGQLEKSDVDEAMRDLELAPEARAEELDVATIQTLCERMRSRAPQLS